MSPFERLVKETKHRLANDDDARFLKTWVKNPLKMGAVMPSSPFLAAKMASYIDLSLQGKVVELGVGTGAITEKLLEAGVKEQDLVLVEYDLHLCEKLSERYPAALVIEGDAYNLVETLKELLPLKAAAFVSGLPLVTKPDKERLKLLRDAFTMMQPTAPFIQFTYSPLSSIPPQKNEFTTKGSDPVWRNMPPARVFVYRQKEAL